MPAIELDLISSKSCSLDRCTASARASLERNSPTIGIMSCVHWKMLSLFDIIEVEVKVEVERVVNGLGRWMNRVCISW